MSGAIVYNTSFIHYDDTGTVRGLSNIKSDEFKNFEIENNLVEDFYLYKKNINNYNIDYFYNISKGLIELEEEQSLIDFNFSLHLITRTSSYNNELTIEYDLKNKKWVFKVRDDAKDKLNLFSNLNFFITKIDNPYFLYRSFIIDLSSTSEVEFASLIEEDISKISVLTVRKFNSYGLKETL